MKTRHKWVCFSYFQINNSKKNLKKKSSFFNVIHSQIVFQKISQLKNDLIIYFIIIDGFLGNKNKKIE